MFAAMPSAPAPSELGTVGYTVTPLLDAARLRALAGIAAEHLPPRLPGFWSASRDRDKQVRRAVHEAVLAVLEPPLRAQFPEYRPVLCSLVAKPGGAPSGEVPLHQDWSFVDEQLWVSLNVWCPLQDVDEGNGCLEVVPGSHRAARQPRAAGAPFLFAGMEPVLREHLRAVPMRAGDALVFDHCLIHGSSVNRTNMVPAVAPLLYYTQAGPDADVCAYEVSPDVHLEHDPGAPPSDGRLVARHRIRLAGG
jgi:hypothetical protein